MSNVSADKVRSSCRLLNPLGVVICAGIAGMWFILAESLPCPPRLTVRRIVKIAIITTEGADVIKSQELVDTFTFRDITTCRILSTKDVRKGLNGCDIVIVPGGSAGRYFAEIGVEGGEVIVNHVRNGGGYLGICAGAYLALSGQSSGLGLINLSTLSGSKTIPGWGDVAMAPRQAGIVAIQLTDAGRKLITSPSEPIMLLYSGGPLIPNDQQLSQDNYRILARFKSDLYSFDVQRGTMLDTPAVVIGECGRGRVIAISPHPEVDESLKSFLKSTLLLVAPVDALHESRLRLSAL